MLEECQDRVVKLYQSLDPQSQTKLPNALNMFTKDKNKGRPREVLAYIFRQKQRQPEPSTPELLAACQAEEARRAAASAGAGPRPTAFEAFVPAESYGGGSAGYFFGTGDRGLGYCLNPTAPIPIFASN